MIPIIETPRLILRPLKNDDFDDFYEYAQDPKVSNPGMWSPYPSREDAQKDFDHLLTLYEQRNLMWWGIENRATGKMIGRCELSDHDPDDKKAELSYALHSDFWGHGYMQEATQPIVNYGFETLNLNRIGAKVYTDNTGSIGVLQKLGMTREGLLRQYHIANNQPKDVYIYSVLRDEWQTATTTD